MSSMQKKATRAREVLMEINRFFRLGGDEALSITIAHDRGNDGYVVTVEVEGGDMTTETTETLVRRGYKQR